MIQQVKRTVLLGLVLMLLCGVACAEPVGDENLILAAQDKWEVLERTYREELTEQQRFVAHFIFDGIGMAHEEEDTELFDAIEACDSLESFVALLGEGVFYPGDPFLDESAVLEKADEILKAAAIERPSCVFAQHFPNGPFKQTDCWNVLYGHYTEVDYGDGWIENEPRVDYTIYFCGEKLQLVACIATEYIDPEEDAFPLLY